MAPPDLVPRIVKKVAPSTVVVFAYDDKGSPTGQGSGFFISHDGHLVTNSHVLAGAYRAEVKTTDGKVYPIGRIVAEDKEADLIRAEVIIPMRSVRPLAVSNLIPEVGEQVVVVGNPLGFEHTVSEGIISAVREIPGFGRILQITAPISSGSSGSPVVNVNGQVIGVATFQVIEGQNLNFAVPGERIARLKEDGGKTLSEWMEGKEEESLGSAEGMYMTGLTLLFRDNYEKALPYFHKAVEKNPSHAEAYLQIAYCSGKLGRWAEAMEAYRQAIRLKPDDALAHYKLGTAYVILGRYPEAIEAYTQAIRIQPDLARAHYSLGLVYLDVGDRGSALEEYRILKRLDSALAKRLFNRIYR